jgi:ElaB/YqjD/DUF883 family membrane-anchored ribosome-binding protein
MSHIMADTQNTKRNGSHSTGEGMRGFSDATKHFRDDAKQLATSVGELSSQAQHAVNAIMQDNPYAAVGAAVGIGFLLGGGLRSRLAGALIAFGGRYFVNNMATQLLNQTRRQ